MIYANPGASFEARVNGYTSGLATVRAWILDNAGDAVYGPSSTGVAEDPAGSGSYIVTLTAPAVAGQFSVGWDTGTVSPATWTSEDLVVTSTAPGPSSPNPGDLCTVADVREFLQKPGGDTDQDDVIQSLITRASRAIMNHTGREFAVEGANPQTRAFDLTDDWSIAGTHGIRIGDLQSAPTAVSFTDAYGSAVGSTITPATDVVCLPQYRSSGEPIRRLRLRPTVSGLHGTYTLSVTGSWGFPVIPADVVQACVMTVGIWMRRDIQAFTSTFNVDEGRVERPRGLPSPVIDILAHYRGFGIG